MREERLHECNQKPERPGKYVLYWMQASLRGEGNLALDWAVQEANRLKLPLIAVFCVLSSYGQANILHYRYLLQGLIEAKAGLETKGIGLWLFKGDPTQIIPDLAGQAALIVMDVGYLRHQQLWKQTISAKVDCRAVWIESNILVPVKTASPKEEWSAYTLRRKLERLKDDFIDIAPECIPRQSSLSMEPDSCLYHLMVQNIEELLLKPPGSVPARMKEQKTDELPGYSAALARYDRFIAERLDCYPENKNNPSIDGTSRMSAALHFGFISPIQMVERLLRHLDIKKTDECIHPGASAFLEELIVRRELAINFCYYRKDYDRPSSLPDWAKRTLQKCERNPRERYYSIDQLEAAQTEDPYWNAAQNQMVKTGYMHGYMRMYWGKRLLAWTRNVEEAWRTAILLNDQYSLDGRDPNGYAGIAWCFGKHDRPWMERPIYGTVRYMNAAGLHRKFDADEYAAKHN
jgi:deoxyribodipyrimidine photo-lyase